MIQHLKYVKSQTMWSHMELSDDELDMTKIDQRR